MRQSFQEIYNKTIAIKRNFYNIIDESILVTVNNAFIRIGYFWDEKVYKSQDLY